MSALDRMLLRDLWHLRGQVFAAALVVACGVAALVSMRSTYYCLLDAQREYYSAYRFADVFAQVKRAPAGLEPQIRAIPGVQAVQARVVRDVVLDVAGLAEPATGRLVSIPERRRPTLNDIYLRSGRYVDPARDDEVLASEAFAAANRLKIGDRVGAIVNGRWKQLRIVGIALSPEYIYEVGAGGLFPDNRRFGVLWMSHAALAAAFDMEGAFNDVALKLDFGANPREVLARLDHLLAPYGGIGAYDRGEQISNRFISDEISQSRVSSTYVPAIFFGVAAFLLHILLTRVVALQRGEIGVLKAFGYESTRVGLHFVKLAVAGIAGGIALGLIAGVYLGEALTDLYRDYYRFPDLAYRGSLRVIVFATVIGVLVAVTGALSAVQAAVGLPPAEAMRLPPPASFRPGALERLGLHTLLSPAWRMIVRNLARRRWKAMLSIAGIACAGGMLVIGGFFLDAINHLMRVQFEVIQREDLTVMFTETRGRDGLYEIGRMPGVWQAEAFRSVPVRLRFQHRSRRVELSALPARGELHRLVDADLKPVPLPADGVVLTDRLAAILGAGAGDLVTVEVLEGRRAVRDVPVTGLVDELTGLGAYMERHALARMLQEDDAITGVRLSVDAALADDLYAVLKGLPMVSGISIRQAMLDSFEDILDRSVRVTTLINVFFACVIAVGIIYNNARISLSERGNELASLRVLGFTRREVGVILLGEQAALTAVAIPLGWLLGYGICALLARLMDTELYRIPLVVSARTYAWAALVVALAAIVSGLLVARRLATLDLVAVLKTRE
ncbi:MAG: FtsX-like permease family protein [Gammaproteobacteria bacterium]